MLNFGGVSSRPEKKPFRVNIFPYQKRDCDIIFFGGVSEKYIHKSTEAPPK